MKKSTFFTLAAAAALLAGTSAARAVTSDGHFSVPSVINPTDTFDFDIAGFNSAGTTGYLLTPDETVTFGTSGTFTAAGINGQNISYTSSETIGPTTTVDTITVSTPTSFITTRTVSGTVIAAVQLDIGDANAGGNTLDYLTPVTGYTATGNVIYSAANTSFTLTPTTTTSNGDESVAAAEGVNFGSAAYTAAPHSFTYVLTYPTLNLPPVPEPSTYAAAAVGALALGTVLLRRNRRSARL